MGSGIPYGFEHGGIGCLTIGEKGDFVPLRQRLSVTDSTTAVWRSRTSVGVDRQLQPFHDSHAFFPETAALLTNDLTRPLCTLRSSIISETSGNVAHPLSGLSRPQKEITKRMA